MVEIDQETDWSLTENIDYWPCQTPAQWFPNVTEYLYHLARVLETPNVQIYQ